MAEYIEREALLERLKFKRNTDRLTNKRYAGLECAIAQVQKAPTADVVEVRHGEWNVTEMRQHLDVECSICKSSFYVYKQGQYRIDRSNYCPNCGADMRGEKDG